MSSLYLGRWWFKENLDMDEASQIRLLPSKSLVKEAIGKMERNYQQLRCFWQQAYNVLYTRVSERYCSESIWGNPGSYFWCFSLPRSEITWGWRGILNILSHFLGKHGAKGSGADKWKTESAIQLSLMGSQCNFLDLPQLKGKRPYKPIEGSGSSHHFINSF